MMDKKKLARMIAFAMGESGTLCDRGAVCERTYGDKANCYSDNNFSNCPYFKALTDEIAAYEEESLREFVGWYKAHLNDLIKYEKDLYTDAKNNRHEDHATFFEGEISMLKRLLSWIDIKREQFLEERKQR